MSVCIHDTFDFIDQRHVISLISAIWLKTLESCIFYWTLTMSLSSENLWLPFAVQRWPTHAMLTNGISGWPHNMWHITSSVTLGSSMQADKRAHNAECQAGRASIGEGCSKADICAETFTPQHTNILHDGKCQARIFHSPGQRPVRIDHPGFINIGKKLREMSYLLSLLLNVGIHPR